MIEIHSNKTFEFLSPIINGFDEEFKEHFNKIVKLRFGIHDSLFSNKIRPFCIYVEYLKFPYDSEYYKNVLFLKEHRKCIYEYNPSPDPVSRIGRFIFQVPESFMNTYSHFIKGEYSKMYTKEQIKSFFNEEDPVIKVLLKTEEARKSFFNRVEQEYGFTDFNEFYPDEYEFPLRIKEEIFDVDSDKKSIYLSEGIKKMLVQEI